MRTGDQDEDTLQHSEDRTTSLLYSDTLKQTNSGGGDTVSFAAFLVYGFCHFSHRALYEEISPMW